MHDLYTPPSVENLSGLYRALYSRNDGGFDLLRRILTRFRRMGYSFETINDAHAALRGPTLPYPET